MEAVNARGEDIELCTLLLEAGADIKIKDNKGYTALDYAKQHQKEKIIELLVKYNEKSEN